MARYQVADPLHDAGTNLLRTLSTGENMNADVVVAHKWSLMFIESPLSIGKLSADPPQEKK
jgi:hypothetical protein